MFELRRRRVFGGRERMRNYSGPDSLHVAGIGCFDGLDTTVPVYVVCVHLTFPSTELMVLIFADFACWAVTR